ncbi:hypothetical protein PIB30_063521, partial [Stylosanthes scabra]|nr:hypothetical protein [Stylosanthes scabra]
ASMDAEFRLRGMEDVDGVEVNDLPLLKRKPWVFRIVVDLGAMRWNGFKRNGMTTAMMHRLIH